MTNYQKEQDYFLEKLSLLERAKLVLKSEFIGIDTIIDEIISNVSAWFCFPELQEKPIVVNLWGLTGVGKTSLINRLTELIDFKDNYFRFDLGDHESNYSFNKSIEYLGKTENKTPAIIVFDEFQHARTLNVDKSEISSDKNRIVWEIIDSGKITYINWGRGIYSLSEFAHKFQAFVKKGIHIEKGYVTNFKESYAFEIHGALYEADEKLNVIPDFHYTSILDIAKGHYDLVLESDLEAFICEKSADEIIEFIDTIINLGQRPITKYLKKSLIFVLGNLDEAYNMSGNLNSDIDADVFHELSKEINVPQIKKALKERFRNEQIARLGNIHIIYPAFSRKNYQDIIEIELNKFKKNVQNQLSIQINFDSSVNELIYKEGVYPTQGVRPIFTTIYQLIKSKIGEIYSDVVIYKLQVEAIHFVISNDNLILQYYDNKEIIHQKEFSLTLILSDLRKNTKDDMQAICAVHETGHAILNVVLMHTIPEMIFSVTANADSEGFVYAKYNWDYIAKNELVPRVAVMLGGLVAEELIFGEENVTIGASGDIEKATQFLMYHYMKSGMGDVPIKYAQNTMEIGYNNVDDIQNKVKEIVIKAKQLAINTLQNEKQLLIELANFLSNESTISQDDFLKLVHQFGTQNFPINIKKSTQFYRKRLQDLKISIENKIENQPILKNAFLSLNKE